MQDAAAFYRNRARAAFYHRRKYPVNSEDWSLWVVKARQFCLAGIDDAAPSRLRRALGIFGIRAPSRMTITFQKGSMPVKNPRSGNGSPLFSLRVFHRNG